jgi:hypothetical protein
MVGFVIVMGWLVTHKPPKPFDMCVLKADMPPCYTMGDWDRDIRARIDAEHIHGLQQEDSK